MADPDAVKAGGRDRVAQRLGLLVRLGRPQFLVYSAVLVSLGGALSLTLGRPLVLGALLQTLLLVWTNHVMTHYVNEFFDLEADRANQSPTGWTGGSRVLAEGLLSPSVAIGAAVTLMLASVAQALCLPSEARLVAWLGLALGWAYTAPPFRLNYRGLGELTVATVLLGLVPLITVQLQGPGDLERYPWPVLVPAFLVQFVRMSVMNMADYEGDVQVGKGTLVVRLGPPRARRLHALGQGLALLWLPLGWCCFGLPGPVALALALTAPLGLWQARRVLRGEASDPRTADSVVFWATTHSATMMIMTLAGLVLGLEDPRSAVLLVIAPAGVALMVVTRIARKILA